MNISLNPLIWGDGNITAVPSVIIDKHLRLCGSLALKVILLILRDKNTYNDEKSIKDKLKCDSSDLSDALNYWAQAGIIKLSEDEEFIKPDLSPVASKDAEPAPSGEKKEDIPKTVLNADNSLRPFLLTREEASAMIKNDKTLGQLILEAQEIFGKTLNSHDTNIFVALYDCYDLTPHFMVMLLNFCKTMGKCTMPYAKKVAEDWISRGIDDNTVDAHVDKLIYLMSIEGRIKKALGIDRNLIKSEQRHIETWVTEYKMDVDIIVKAYEVCIEKINKLNFNYMNKVLTNWYQNSITTGEEAESFISSKGKSSKPKEESDFMKMLEQNYDKE